jgi:hypothetical protein
MAKARVFISHSSKDKEFVRKLVGSLKQHHLNVWLDEKEIRIGDSIVARISEGLADSTYLVVVLSKTAVKSQWVQEELNSALASQIDHKGVVVLPVLIEDCDIPPLLRSRLYADFRTNFQTGLDKLLAVFKQESESSARQAKEIAPASGDPCLLKLSVLPLADLRRLIAARMSRSEVGAIWYDVLGSAMENDMINRPLVDCVIELLDRAKNRNKLSDVIAGIYKDRPDLSARAAGAAAPSNASDVPLLASSDGSSFAHSAQHAQTVSGKSTQEKPPLVVLTPKQMISIFVVCALLGGSLCFVSLVVGYVFLSLAVAVVLFGFLGGAAHVENRWGKFGGSVAGFVATLLILLELGQPKPLPTNVIGMVDVDGIPVTKATVILLGTSFSDNRREITAANPGRFEFRGVPGLGKSVKLQTDVENPIDLPSQVSEWPIKPNGTIEIHLHSPPPPALLPFVDTTQSVDSQGEDWQGRVKVDSAIRVAIRARGAWVCGERVIGPSGMSGVDFQSSLPFPKNRPFALLVLSESKDTSQINEFSADDIAIALTGPISLSFTINIPKSERSKASGALTVMVEKVP